jgi:hypothetical protein
MIPLRKYPHMMAITAAYSLALLAPGRAVPADEAGADLSGTWKLVVLAFGDDEYAVIRIDRRDGKDRALVLAAETSALGVADNLTVDSLATEGGVVRFTLKGSTGSSRFEGRLAADGPAAGKIRGTFRYRNETFPARLERASDARLAYRRQGSLIRTFAAAARNPDPLAKTESLRQGLQRYKGNPTNYLFYMEILATAAAAGLPPEEVGLLADEMFKEAEPHGVAWIQELRIRALKALTPAKPYADISLAIAQEAERSMDKDARPEQQAAIVGMLARAASLVGRADLAREAEARSEKIERLLDEEYHKTVPPFRPEPYKGRKDPRADAVAVMELFTGVQCIPCVATDVAFDALLNAYQPSEFIGLQYHLHVPGFDALTNKDTEARRNYYAEEIGGTPAVMLNGHPLPPGGGLMHEAEDKFKEYRGLIDRQLDSAKGASINLKATRSGDKVKISAEATVPASAKGKDGEEAKARPRLRLVLTERAVRYIGNNKLRIHHHVVRGFPGGVEGKELSAGETRLQLELSLADVRRGIEDYLSSILKAAPFLPPTPPIAMEDLSVVAFVQDDATRSILHAVSVPVTASKP